MLDPQADAWAAFDLHPAALIDLRRQLLDGLSEHPDWLPVEADLANILRREFDASRLEFRRIDLLTPPAVLDNLIRFEAVHAIRDRRELARRLMLDRRCFGYFHPALPDEPVAFTEIALTRGLAGRVQPLLNPDSPVLDPRGCHYAMFYSISSCHEGLRGVPFGNALIRRSMEAIAQECPWISNFATVSPVPGFRSWVARSTVYGDRERATLAARVKDPSWITDVVASTALELALLPMCASYLLHAKRGDEPMDPVARFHLANGARLERLNWLGDISLAGLDRSAGLTANYVYALSEIDSNQEAYRTGHSIVSSRWIELLANAAGN